LLISVIVANCSIVSSSRALGISLPNMFIMF
jgi:hypothetical protein